MIWEWAVPAPHTFDETVSEMRKIGAKFIGIDTGFDEENPGQKTNFAKTSFDMIGQQTNSYYKFNNYLYFNFHTDNETGEGIGGLVADAITSLIRDIDMDVTVVGESNEFCNQYSASKFLSSVGAISASPVNGVSGLTANSFMTVTPGTQLKFNVYFENNFCENGSDTPMIFEVQLTARGNLSYLSSQQIYIVVP